MTYQSHDGKPATSNSQRKLERIKLPLRLTGKSVLDIGCNEGFFCAEAARRGAGRVVGFDQLENAIAFATQTYGDLGIDFRVGRWNSLPEGPFDYVLWLSSMHYELDPLSVFRRVFEVLAPDGIFVLECGVWPSKGKQMVPVGRPRDMPWYPTSDFLEEQLSRARLSYSIASRHELTPGDDVPRWVYHCTRIKPTVLLLRGGSQSGKSTLANRMKYVATKVIALDALVGILGTKGYAGDIFGKFLLENFDNGNNLESLIDKIDEFGFTKDYVGLILAGIVASDELVVVEGYVTDSQANEMQRQIGGRAVIWDAARPDSGRFPRF